MLLCQPKKLIKKIIFIAVLMFKFSYSQEVAYRNTSLMETFFDENIDFKDFNLYKFKKNISPGVYNSKFDTLGSVLEIFAQKNDNFYCTIKINQQNIYEEYISLENTTISYYYHNGKLKQVNNFRLDKLNGIQLFYDTIGNLTLIENFIDGFEDGTTYYMSSSRLVSQLSYKRGRLFGDIKNWYGNGNTKIVAIATDDRVKLLKYYNDKGEVIFKGEGNLKEYDNGVIASSKNYKSGFLNGISIYYYNNGKIKSEEIYSNGLKNGLWKYYSEEGVLISEEKWNKGKRLSK